MKNAKARLLSSILTLLMVSGSLTPQAFAAEPDSQSLKFEKVENSAVSASLLKPVKDAKNASEKPGEAQYGENENVRVSIILEDESTIERFGSEDIANDKAAMDYRADLKANQETMTNEIARKIGSDLDVKWNLTLAANIISANVPFGQIEAIKSIKGVKDVVIENRYEPMVVDNDLPADPNMATSSAQIGSTAAWQVGYTGAGSTVAIIDTGIDTDHQSFDASAYEYSLGILAGKKNMDPDEYKESIGVLTMEDVAAVADQLNAQIDPEKTYVTSKIPYAYNYVDEDYDITHDNDTQGEHGSHVEGIAAANAYIPVEGGFEKALDSVNVQGVAPDAQILTMKVFGKGGGAYDSDYMVAIEDALVLGADSVNLSLGSGNPGPSKEANYAYQDILDSLVNSGTVVTMSAGNSGEWAEQVSNGSGTLYGDDISFDMTGSPGSYTNSLSVASVDNDGVTGNFFSVDGTKVFYTETTGYSNAPMTTIAGEQEYVFLDGFGVEEDYEGVDVEGKVVFVSRGTSSFYQKGDIGAEHGAIAVVIYNNQPGTINMDLSDYSHSAPCVSITQADGAAIKAASTKAEDGDYYTGTMTVEETVGSGNFNSDYYTMSDFSSWGVPGSLEIKPEITAPGGNIYSVNGAVAGGKAYENMSGTSMAAPQVTGMAAVVAQYIRENGLDEQTGVNARTLAQSLLMSTAVPLLDEDGNYYPVLRQGAGLGNVGNAVEADSYILMADDANAGAVDGKVKAELGDDPDRKGIYTVEFTVNNLTDEEKEYTFGADVFTQDIYEGEDASYLLTSTTPLAASVTYTVEGKEFTPTATYKCDLNNDGVTDAKDAQIIIDYVAENTTEIDEELADVDNSGLVTSYDAYLILTGLEVDAVKVDAGKALNVKVDIALDDSARAYLDEKYENGAYVEAYIKVQSANTEDGAVMPAHSIPVLGFYGSWTEASMFDVGTRPEFETGDETRMPYLYADISTGNLINGIEGNTYAVTYEGEDGKFYFGGNPFVPDEKYMPERNAINSNDTISGINFVAIRNAMVTRFQAVNETTGEVLGEAFPGAVDSAYYYANGQKWMNTGYTLNTKFTPSDAAEGDKLTASLTLAPEYYVDAEGNVDWDALEDGASFTIPMVVDNTAPELKNVAISLKNNTLEVTASDNQYVAAVLLTNKAGTVIKAYTGAKQDIQPGEEALYELDLTGVNGKRFLVQVLDYANNASTFVLNQQIGEEEPLPEMIAFDCDNNFWTSFTKTSTNEDLVNYAPSDLTFFAATIVDHLVFASTDTGDLYVMPEDDLTEMTYVCNLGATVSDMAYNKADGKIYGVAGGSLITIDKLSGAVTEVGEIGVATNTLACDANGTFYCNAYGTGDIYKFTLETIAAPELVVKTDLSTSQFVQGMEINPNTGKLMWNSYYAVSFWGMTFGFSYLYEIDTTAGTYTKYNDLWDELTCLIIPEAKTAAGGDWTTPTDEVSGIQISDTTLAMLRGGTAKLSATVQPWTATDRTVTWSSSDEKVVTVDAKGVVTAVGVGAATITATSNLDSKFTAACEVTVEALDITLKGAIQDKDGNPSLFTWNMAEDTTWTAGVALETSIDSVTLDTTKNELYVMDAVADTWAMHVVDPATGATKATYANAIQLPLWDMQYTEKFSTADKSLVSAVYYYYFLPAKDPAALDGSAFSLQSRLQSAGAQYLVAVATLGAEEIEYSGEVYDAERYILLDNAGNIWNWYTYAEDDAYSAILSQYTSNISESFEGYEDDMYCSMVAGDDGNLYLSAFTGTTNNLYRLTIDDENAVVTADYIGNVGEEVWPAALYAVESNSPAAQTASIAAAAPKAVSGEVIKSELVSEADLAKAAASVEEASAAVNASRAMNNKNEAAVEAAANVAEAKAAAVKATGSLNAVSASAGTMSTSGEIGDPVVNNNKLVIDVTEDNAVTNGKYKVTYDPEVLEFVEVTASDYDSSAAVLASNEKDGVVTIAFAHTSAAPAGRPVIKVVFDRLTDDVTEVKVETLELNEGEGSEVADEDVVELDGTDDGHDWGEWFVTVEPTCTKSGVEERVCDECGTTETRTVEALGHNFVTEKGYTGLKAGKTYCDRCGLIISGSNSPLPILNPITAGKLFPSKNKTKPAEPTKPVEEEKPVEEPVVEEPETEAPVEEPAPEAPVKEMTFTDISADDWFYTAVEYLYNAGIMNGTSDTTFSPEKELNRATIVTILYRLEGEPAVEAAGTFSDVPADEWYTAAVEWAASVGLVNGYEDGTYAPLKAVTRQELSAILYRYAKLNGVTIYETTATLSEKAVVSDWAAESVTWAVSEGLLVEGEDINATENANRAEVAGMIYTYLTKTAK